MPPRTLELAVRALAEFACREGDLDAAHVGPTAVEGQRAHARVQRQWHAETEVVVSRNLDVDGMPVRLSGRIDLLDRAADVVGEIKTVCVPLVRLGESRRGLHRAQAKLYAWLYLEGRDARVTIELVYVNARADSAAPEIDRFDAAASELHDFALRAVRRRVDWERRLHARRDALARSAGALDFPWLPWRAGQRRLAVATWRALEGGGALLVEAPTGIGKTAAALYPAIKALGRGALDQVQWLTAKNSGRAAAFDALERLRGAGLETTAVLLRARAAACFCERGLAARDEDGLCAFARGFHDRVPAAMDDALDAGPLDGERLDALAHEHQVCPHVLGRALVPWVPIVVCDYNHVHDPLACVPALVERPGRRALIVDEAHNLDGRARAMHGGTLSRLRCLDAAAATRASDPALARALERLAARLLEVGRVPAPAVRSTATRPAASPDAPPPELTRAVDTVLEAVAAGRERDDGGALGAFFAADLARYRMAAEAFDDTRRVVVERESVGRRVEVRLELVCLDASAPLSRRHAEYRGCVFLSATLRPFAARARALGLDGAATALRLDSPYDASRLHLSRVGWIDVRAGARDASMVQLVELLAVTVGARAGHYAAFFPSYAYAAKAHAAFVAAHPDVETWCQARDGGEAQLLRTLARLARPGPTLGFAIVGGTYAEGVDYAGEMLVGAIVVSTGLPALDERNALEREHHAAAGRDGFEEACLVPGLARVLQSAGRVIRSETDVGVVTFVDPRFGERFYRDAMPRHLLSDECAGVDAYARALAGFWKKHDATRAVRPANAATART